MTAADLLRHKTPKTAIARALGALVEDRDLGYVFVASPRGFATRRPDREGFVRSPLLGVIVRLVRRPGKGGGARYRLETRPA